MLVAPCGIIWFGRETCKIINRRCPWERFRSFKPTPSRGSVVHICPPGPVHRGTSVLAWACSWHGMLRSAHVNGVGSAGSQSHHRRLSDCCCHWQCPRYFLHQSWLPNPDGVSFRRRWPQADLGRYLWMFAGQGGVPDTCHRWQKSSGRSYRPAWRHSPWLVSGSRKAPRCCTPGCSPGPCIDTQCGLR